MEKSINLRKLRNSDGTRLSTLHREVFGTAAPREYWNWKYIENPCGDHYSYVAEVGDDIIGFVGGTPWRLSFGGREFRGAQGSDLMVRPDWRRRDVFFSLNRVSMTEIKARASFHFGVTNSISYRIFRERYGYGGFQVKKTCRVLSLLKVFPAIGAKGTFTRLLTTPWLKTGTRLLKGSLTKKKSAAGAVTADMRVFEVEKFDKSFDELWVGTREDLGVATVRNRSYLEWRYAGHPFFRYKILKAMEGETLKGFIVLRVEDNKGIRCGLIVDILLSKQDLDTAGLLIDSAVDFFRNKGVAMAICWHPSSGLLHNILEGKSFALWDQDPTWILIDIFEDSIEKDTISQRDKWSINMGDCEAL